MRFVVKSICFCDKLEQSGEWMMKWYRKAGIGNV